MRIFVTGIAGMIGYHSAKHFKSKGWDVVGVDNFNDYYEVELKRHRAKLLEDIGVEVIEKDIRDISQGDEELRDVDVVLHLAAYANPRHAQEEPQLYIDTNISGTQHIINVLEQAEWSKSIPVVYASSSCVMHGQPLPWNETDRPAHQNNPYGWSKRANECQFMYSKIIRTAGLRFFTVYGPLGRPDMALFKFTNQIVNGETLTVYNYGDMKRDFTYVQDIVDGIELVVNKFVSDETMTHEIYNIGYGEQVDLMHFIHEIEKNLDRKANLDLVPPHPADVPETWSDTTKLQALGYKPTTSIEDGVAKFIEWYKSYYKVN